MVPGRVSSALSARGDDGRWSRSYPPIRFAPLHERAPESISHDTDVAIQALERVGAVMAAQVDEDRAFGQLRTRPEWPALGVRVAGA